MEEEKYFQLGGREFAGVSDALTAAQDTYILAHARRAGVLEVLADAALPDERRSEELLTRIMLSGEMFHILSGVLTEKDKSWSRQEADRNAAVFAQLTGMADKLAMQSALVGFVLGFFGSGAGSSPTSPKSSSPSAKGLATAREAPATSEISPLSSEPPPDTIQAASAR